MTGRTLADQTSRTMSSKTNQKGPKGVAPAPVESKKQGKRVLQSDMPAWAISKCYIIPQALWNYYGGQGAAPLRLAASLNISPQSSNWRYLTGASMAYGLTEGGYHADEIKLTELGKRIVAPTSVGDDRMAVREAVMRPRLVGDFLRRMDKRKLPPESIAQNILIEMGVPQDRAADTLALIIENAREAGFLLDTKTGPFFDLNGSGAPASAVVETDREDFASSVLIDKVEPDQENLPPELETGSQGGFSATPVLPPNKKVFISHGPNRAIVEQIKKILRYGKYEPIVAVETESAAKPLSQKVFGSMRDCFAGVINVHSEGEWQAPDGSLHPKLNENVLIEIGAAMALYPDRFVLLVQEGVVLPSNISGLYQCRYEGAQLGFESAMKLLEVFNEFEKK